MTDYRAERHRVNGFHYLPLSIQVTGDLSNLAKTSAQIGFS
jgi:hypothetical protein